MMMLLATKVKKGEKTKVLFFLPNEKDLSHKTPNRNRIHETLFS